MEAAVEPVVLAARAQALEETAEARRRLGQARAVLVSRSIQQAPFELKSYVRDYGLSVSHLCVILTPESRKNLNVTPALEDSLLARVREAAALYRSNKPAWRSLQKAGMTADFSWGPSAKQYLEVYQKAMG